MDITKEECQELINLAETYIESTSKDVMNLFEVLKKRDANIQMLSDFSVITILTDENSYLWLYKSYVETLKDLKDKKKKYEGWMEILSNSTSQ